MILVTLGTQDKEFRRILEELDRLIIDGIIKDKVVVQAGMTKYESNNMEIFDFLPKEEFDKLLKKCNLLITHGGVGSILSGLNNGKKVIAVPRLVKYKEHQSNHQVEIVNLFEKQGYIIGSSVENLKDSLSKIKTFKPKKYDTDNSLMLKIVSDNLKDKSKVMFISSTGGHLEELMNFKVLFDRYKYHIVTEKTNINKKLKDKYPVSYLIYGTKVHPIMYIIKLLLNGFKSLYLYIKIRPKYIVTTGTHTAIPMCILGKIFGSKIIYIETFANINSKTQTGNFIYKYKLYNVFIVQWKEMLKLYPKAIYGGSIF